MDNKVKFEPKVEGYEQRRPDHKGHNHQGSHNKRRSDKPKRQGRTSTAFRGEHKDLHGFIYDYDTTARPNQYEKTTERIGQWAKQNLDHSLDIWNAIRNLEAPDMAAWNPPTPKAGDVVAQARFNEKIKNVIKREEKYENNRTVVYSIVFGQCSATMKAQLESQDDWDTINVKHDLVTLLKSIKVWALNQQSSTYPTMAMISSSKSLFKMNQGKYEDLIEFKKRFTAVAEVLDHIEADLSGYTKGLANKILKKEHNVDRKDANEAQIEAAQKTAKNRFLAGMFLDGADPLRYRAVLEDLRNQYLKGKNEYPENVTAAFNMLQNWSAKTKTKEEEPYNDGVNFAQGSEPPSNQHEYHSNDLCYRCGDPGHHAKDCTKGRRSQASGTANAMVDEVAGSNGEQAVNDMTNTVVGNASAATAHVNHEKDQAYECTLCTGDAVADEDGAAVGGHDNDEFDAYECAFCTAGTYDNGDCTGDAPTQTGGEQKEQRSGSFDHSRAHVLPSGSVGLDSMSTVDIFGDERLLTNIRRATTSMRIVCNAGSLIVTQIGTFSGYGDVWYHSHAIANILSLRNVQERYHVSFDSCNGNQFLVHRGDGTARVFRPTRKGLYASQVLGSRNEVMMVSTVKDNLGAYTRREIKRATEARRLMQIIGRPSEQQLRRILDQNQLRNCGIHSQDVNNARNIFGPDAGSLRGKTVRRSEPHVDLVQRPIPDGILERHREATVCFDVMYVSNIPFLVSTSRYIKFHTAEALLNRKSETLMAGLKRVKMIYARRGFVMNQAVGDNEFASLETALSDIGIALNTVSRDEHVPEVERHIRTLKERCRATFNSLPFTKLPARMIVEMVYTMTFWLHAFPALDGVSAHMSPREIITGVPITAEKHCVIPFGAYVQTHEQHDNTMKSRTVGALALRPTGNAQGGHFFLSLQTGKRISRNRWTELPIPADVVRRVHQLADNAGGNRLTFGDRANNEDGAHSNDSGPESSSETQSANSADSSDDSDREWDDTSGRDNDKRSNQDDEVAKADDPDDAAAQDVRESLQEPTTVKQEDEEWHPEQDEIPQPEEKGESSNGEHEDAHGEEPDVCDEHIGLKNLDTQHYRPSLTEGHESTSGHSNAGVDDNADHGHNAGVQHHAHGSQTLDEAMTQKYGKRTERHKLRPRRKANYNPSLCAQTDYVIAPRFDATRLASRSVCLEPLFNVLLTQYGMRRGLKMFGKDGDKAVKTEMLQLHNREVMEPKSGTSLSNKDRSSALSYLMFLKKKKNGTVKGRGCADGRKQRGTMSKAETSSPTVSAEAVFLVITIAAKEKRDVAVMDIPGAFLQTDLEEEKVYIKFQGRMAEMLALIDPSLYRHHITVEKDRPVLYAELKKALYGMLQSALRFWEQVSTDLVGLGFEINPYDSCVANRIIDGKQQTICWHVDDFLMTHEDPAVNDATIKWFNKKYGKLAEVTTHRGMVHEYLGMTLDFTQPGKVTVNMTDYVMRMVDEAPEEFGGVATSPAANHLFDISEACKTLDEGRAARFHHMVAKALFVCKRARPDIQLTVGFLSTRVRAPNEGDWRKIKRLVQYLRGTSEIGLTLEADSGQIVKWWIDAAFAVHDDMRSQSGATMTLGKGMVYCSTTKQKLNTRSSTEAELVGVSDFLPQVLWTRYFLNEQGYGLRDNIIYQDNQSSMLLASNGRASSGKRTRHINIRFFFVADRAKSGELDIQYCPTDKMIADFFTKPLQGSKFKELRATILNMQD